MSTITFEKDEYESLKREQELKSALAAKDAFWATLKAGVLGFAIGWIGHFYATPALPDARQASTAPRSAPDRLRSVAPTPAPGGGSIPPPRPRPAGGPIHDAYFYEHPIESRSRSSD